MQIFHAVAMANSNWGPWELFKECSVTCGKGVTHHTRKCISYESIPNGCAGESKKVESCDKGCCKGTNLHVTILL